MHQEKKKRPIPNQEGSDENISTKEKSHLLLMKKQKTLSWTIYRRIPVTYSGSPARRASFTKIIGIMSI